MTGRHMIVTFMCITAVPGMVAGCASPKGVRWTIQCMEATGPQASTHIEQIADTLRQTPGIDPDEVTVVHDRDGNSRLYYGTYYRRLDAETGRRSIPRELVRDLGMIKTLGTGGSVFFFRRATKVRKPQPDVGNPDWMLGRSGGAFTLQVGVFEATDEFFEYKQAAAEYCAALRSKGYDAYYHHDSACSVVTVGAFAEGAVVTTVVRERGMTRRVTRFSDEINALMRDDLLKYNLWNGMLRRSFDDTGRKLPPAPAQVVRVPGTEPID